MPGEELWRRAPLALQRNADTTALVGTWNHGTVALQASSEECRGHPKETALSGYEVTWLLFKLDFEVTVNPKSSFSSQIWLSINLRIVRAGLGC